MEGKCKYHPIHNQLKGVCPFCLRERLLRITASSSTPSMMISSASYESSSGASPGKRMGKRRKLVKRTKSSLPASSEQIQFRRSKSVASVMGIISSTRSMIQGTEDGRGKGRKEVTGKVGFWYRLLGIEKKKKKTMIVNKRIDDEVAISANTEIQ